MAKLFSEKRRTDRYINLYTARLIAESADAKLRWPGAKHFRPFYDEGTVATENRLS